MANEAKLLKMVKMHYESTAHWLFCRFEHESLTFLVLPGRVDSGSARERLQSRLAPGAGAVLEPNARSRLLALYGSVF